MSIRVKLYPGRGKTTFLHGVWWILGYKNLLGVYKRAHVMFLLHSLTFQKSVGSRQNMEKDSDTTSLDQP